MHYKCTSGGCGRLGGCELDRLTLLTSFACTNNVVRYECQLNISYIV